MVQSLMPRWRLLGPFRMQARILPLQRRNLTAGEGHIIDEIITHTGGINMGAANSPDMMSRVSLEGGQQRCRVYPAE